MRKSGIFQIMPPNIIPNVEVQHQVKLEFWGFKRLRVTSKVDWFSKLVNQWREVRGKGVRQTCRCNIKFPRIHLPKKKKEDKKKL